MAENKQDIFARAFSELSSLRKNIGQMTTERVLEMYVTEYHTVLDKLEGIKIETSEFRIPDSAVQPRVTASWLEGEKSYKSYSEEKYVDKSFILTKIDAILGYFEIITSEKPRKIGYSKPDRS